MVHWDLGAHVMMDGLSQGEMIPVYVPFWRRGYNAISFGAYYVFVIEKFVVDFTFDFPAHL